MATAKNVQATDEGWETVAEPYGDSWDFDKNPILIGLYTGRRTVEQPDLNNEGSMRDANVYEITEATSGDKVSVWGTYVLDEAFGNMAHDTQVRISYQGKVDLSGGRSVRKFKVDKKA